MIAACPVLEKRIEFIDVFGSFRLRSSAGASSGPPLVASKEIHLWAAARMPCWTRDLLFPVCPTSPGALLVLPQVHLGQARRAETIVEELSARVGSLTRPDASGSLENSVDPSYDACEEGRADCQRTFDSSVLCDVGSMKERHRFKLRRGDRQASRSAPHGPFKGRLHGSCSAPRRPDDSCKLERSTLTS